MKNTFEKGEHSWPVEDEQIGSRRADGASESSPPELPLFRQFVALLFGSFVGSLLGAVLFKVLSQVH